MHFRAKLERSVLKQAAWRLAVCLLANFTRAGPRKRHHLVLVDSGKSTDDAGQSRSLPSQMHPDLLQALISF